MTTSGWLVELRPGDFKGVLAIFLNLAKKKNLCPRGVKADIWTEVQASWDGPDIIGDSGLEWEIYNVVKFFNRRVPEIFVLSVIQIMELI